MKYGVLLCGNTENIGDDIQSYAALRFLPKIDCVVDREKLDTFGLEGTDEPVSVIMNAWYMYNKSNWPPSPVINPLFLSMHISAKDYFGIGDRFLDAIGGEYLKKYAPIGARDESTAKMLRDKGIEAFVSGCLTLTLELPPMEERSDEVILVDIEEEASRYLKQTYPNENWQEATHTVDPDSHQNLSLAERFELVERLLKRYQRAKCVITRRLHCALPCLALGTPVLLIYSQDVLDRMQSFLPLLHSVEAGELRRIPDTFNIQTPPNNPDGYLPIRKDLEERCRRFIVDAERGIVVPPPSFPLHEVLVWQKELLYGSEYSFRKQIESQQSWIHQLEHANRWEKERLAAAQDRIQELTQWTKEQERTKAYLIEQTQTRDTRIADLESWVAQLEQAKAYLEEQAKAKDARVAEMESWVAQLEQAKAYLEGQAKNKDARIAELEGWAAELEQAKVYLEEQTRDKSKQIMALEDQEKQKAETISQRDEEIRELRLALRTEIAKPWHQKLLHGSRESDYGL